MINLMHQGKVDVVMRTRNSSELLKQCLDSVFQEIPVRKVIIVDGGSTDNTLKIASGYKDIEIYVKPDLNIGRLHSLVLKFQRLIG